MSGLYDRLLSQLGDDDPEPGLTTLDIADLPEHQRRVMLALLRSSHAAPDGLPYAALADKLDHPPNLDTTLDELVRLTWVIRMGEGNNRRYKVNLRRKRASGLHSNLWTSVLDYLAAQDDEPPTTASGSAASDSAPTPPAP